VFGCENRLKIRETGDKETGDKKTQDKETKRQRDKRTGDKETGDGRGLTLEGMISILNGKDAETSSA
jgi:hypothetical protein